MNRHWNRPSLWRALDDESGQALVEYALILFLVVLVCIAALGALGSQTSTLFQAVVADF